MTASRRKTPTGLGLAGAKLWREITSKYELRADELLILEGACRETDLIVRLDADLVGDTLMKKGSQGQPVINPIVSELRQHRATLAAMLRQLKLPDDEGGVPEERSTQARAAANARWSRRA